MTLDKSLLWILCLTILCLFLGGVSIVKWLDCLVLEREVKTLRMANKVLEDYRDSRAEISQDIYNVQDVVSRLRDIPICGEIEEAFSCISKENYEYFMNKIRVLTGNEDIPIEPELITK